MLDIRSDMVCPDICKIGNPFLSTPLKKGTGCPIVSHPGILVADVGGKKLKKAIAVWKKAVNDTTYEQRIKKDKTFPYLKIKGEKVTTNWACLMMFAGYLEEDEPPSIFVKLGMVLMQNIK